MANFAAKNFTLYGHKLEAGQYAPDFQLVDMNSEIKTLKDYGNKIKVISCIPSIDTGVCDMQTRTFVQKYENNPEVVLLNVSVDLPFAFDRWCCANKTNAICLSDYRTNQFGKDYGVLMEPYMTLYRSVFVLTPDNKLALAMYNEDVGQPVNFDKVYETVDSLLSK